MPVTGLNTSGKEKRKLFCLFCLALITVIAAFIGASGRSEDRSDEVFAPVTNITSDCSGYVLTINLSGGETEEDFLALYDYLEEKQLPAVFFSTSGYAASHKSNLLLLKKSGYKVGLLLTETSSLGKSELMRKLALDNDAFYALLGLYPDYVRSAGVQNKYTGEVINLYGQTYVLSSEYLTAYSVLEEGDIVELEFIDSSAVETLEKAVSAAKSRGLSACTPDLLLKH